jgi:NAD-dependent DNA ligase
VDIVFTGKAVLSTGHTIPRDILTDAAVRAGFTVRGKVDKRTGLLVWSGKSASVKVQTASNMGVNTMWYWDFLEILKSMGVGDGYHGDLASLRNEESNTSKEYGDLL